MTIKPFSAQHKEVDNDYRTIQQHVLSFVDLRHKWAKVPIDKEMLAKQCVCTQYEFIKGNNEPDIVKSQGRGILWENVSKMLKCSWM